MKSEAEQMETLLLAHPWLAARLALAEDVCRMYGWSAGMAQTDREKAAYMIWVKWLNAVGGTTSDAINPMKHPHLNDAAIERMARERDEIRERTLARITTAPAAS